MMTLERIQWAKTNLIKDPDPKTLGDFLVEEACKNIKTKKDNMTLIIINLRQMTSKKKSFF
jgi:hypothetical protein